MKRRARWAGVMAAVLLLSWLVVATPATRAAAGDLDPTFGAGGVAGGVNGVALALARQPGDGKLVVAGRCCLTNATPEEIDATLARYHPDGKLDTGFGQAGVVVTDFGEDRNSSLQAVAVLGDGRILAAGATESDLAAKFALARYQPDGSLDPRFGGGDGLVITGFPSTDAAASAVALQDDKVVVAGRSGDDFALARYDAAGALDPSFGGGGDGTLTTALGAGSAARALAIQPDGKLVAAGGGGGDFAVARYDAAGVLDASFGGGDGMVTTDLGGSDVATAVVLSAGGTLTVVGTTGADLALARYDAAGVLDPGFGGGDGVVTTDLGATDAAAAAALAPDGGVWAGGRSGAGLDFDLALVRYDAIGALDASFGGGDGVATTDLGGLEGAGALLVQPDGRPVVAGGTSEDGQDGTFAVARYEASDLSEVTDLRLSLSAGPEPVLAGGTIRYLATAANLGPGTAYQVSLSDPLPPATVFVSAEASQGSCRQAGGSVTCDLRGLAPGRSATVDILVTATAPGTVANTASLAFAGAEAAPADNAATATTTVVAAPGVWSAAPPPLTPRAAHTATRLPDGRVLLVGGQSAGGVVATAELFDPTARGGAGAWSLAPSPTVARSLHTATLLADGRVLVVGGDVGGVALAAAEIFDPAANAGAGVWSTADPLAVPRRHHTATLLGDGGVLVVGGDNELTPGERASLGSATVYRPGPPGAAGSWTVVAGLAEVRTEHTATSLPDGRVLVVGGYRGQAFDAHPDGPHATPEVFDPGSGTWTAAAGTLTRRWLHAAAALDDGRVLLAGGSQSIPPQPIPAAATFGGAWALTANMTTPRAGHEATTLGGGVVLVTGGTASGSAERYDPATGRWTPAGVMSGPRGGHSATRLLDGRVLVVSGATADLYSPPAPVTSPGPAAAASGTAGTGYWLGAADGGVFAFGNARFAGSTGALRLNQPVVAMAASRAGLGYWLGAADGGVFAFGDARFLGSTGAIRLNQPVVGMAATPSGAGYWLVARDGGVFAFGDARFAGSMASRRLSQPVVGIAATPSGAGYWLVAADGGVFAFGDARFAGSTGAIRLNQPVVGMAPTPSGAGYWLVARDGGVFAFGDARFAGSMASRRLSQPVVGMAASPSGAGYWLVAADGGVFAFGDARFLGSTGALRLNQPVVAMAAKR